MSETSTREPNAVTGRAVALGLAGVVIVCALTPFNNFVANNTFLVGNLMPAAAALLLVLAVVVIDAPLRRWRPRWALRRGELGVAFSMVLVSCAMPGAGLMRYLPGSLTGTFAAAGQQGHAEAARVASIAAADWTYPAFTTPPERRADDPVVTEFLGKSPGSAFDVTKVPWRAWLRPALAWGVFVLLLYGAIVALLAVVGPQWVGNERLRFPIAEVYTSLLETPRPGTFLPPALRAWPFWVAGGTVLALHALNILAAYDARWPAVPLGYDLNGVFAEPPLSAVTYGLKAARVMFTVVGLCYFMPTKVAGSLLFFFGLYNAAAVTTTAAGGELTLPMQRDQTTGAVAVIAFLILYAGRRHWTATLRAMVGRHDAAGTGDTPVFPLAGWAATACVARLTVWLWLAGSPPLNAVLIVLALLTLFLVTARVVAETGLIYVQLHTALYRPWIYAATLPGVGDSMRTTPRGGFLLAQVYNVFGHDLRENGLVYAQHAGVTADAAARPARPAHARLAMALLAAVAVGFVVSGASMLACEYNYETTLDRSRRSPINEAGVVAAPRVNVLDVSRELQAPPGRPMFGETHGRAIHFILGAAVTAAVAVGHLCFAAFPLHPIGAVMCYSYSLQNTWFSVLLGWLAKLLVLRVGGARLFAAARPIALGLVVGETAAIALSAAINFAIHAAGAAYAAPGILPQ